MVISQGHFTNTDLWSLTDDTWYLVETNFYHWKTPGDGRREIAINAMNAIGEKNVTLDNVFDMLWTSGLCQDDKCIYVNKMSAALEVFLGEGNDKY